MPPKKLELKNHIEENEKAQIIKEREKNKNFFDLFNGLNKEEKAAFVKNFSRHLFNHMFKR